MSRETTGALLARKAQISVPSSTFWPEIPTVGRAARGLGICPEAPLGPRLITFKRRFAPSESCPVAPPAAPAAPRRGGAPGRHWGAARASGAFPQVPWTAPTRGGRPRPPATRRTSSPGRSAPPWSSQVPRPAGAREGRGGWRGRRGRAARAAGARVLGAGLPPPSSARLASRRRLAGAKASCELSARAAPRALAPTRRPPPSGGGSRRHRRLRVRRHLPRRHLFSSRSIGASSAPLEPPRLPSPRWCSGVAPQPAPPPPLTRPTRSCRSLAAALRGLGVCSAAVRPARAGTCSPHARH